MRLPAAAQSAIVPVTVSVKVSQDTPSTQVLSPLAAPVPVAVPVHAKAGPPVPILPEAGLAECNRLLKIARTIRAIALIKNRVPAVMRAIGEIAFFFIGTRGGCGWLLAAAWRTSRSRLGKRGLIEIRHPRPKRMPPPNSWPH